MENEKFVKLRDVEDVLDEAQLVSNGRFCGYSTEDVRNRLRNIPSADAVQVVHCRDCIQYKIMRLTGNGESPKYCKLFSHQGYHMSLGPDGFCSEGRLRNEEGE